MKVQTRNQVIIDLLTEYDDNDTMIVDVFDKPCVYDVAENYEMHLSTNEVTRVLEMVADEYEHTNGINYNTILDAIDSVRKHPKTYKTDIVKELIAHQNEVLSKDEVNEAAVQSFPTYERDDKREVKVKEGWNCFDERGEKYLGDGQWEKLEVAKEADELSVEDMVEYLVGDCKQRLERMGMEELDYLYEQMIKAQGE